MIVSIVNRQGSHSGRALERALVQALPTINIGRVTSDGARTCRTKRYAINWGCSQSPMLRQQELVWSNSPLVVAMCANKWLTFNQLLANDVLQHVAFTDNLPLANEWLEADGKVVVRHVVNGHSGQGIEIVRRGTEIPAAPLYTRYFRKHAEYRLHVGYGNVILIQQKRRRNGIQQHDEEALVRTHANGWVFSIANLSCDRRGYRDNLSALGLAAANAVGAGHCAVDVLVNHESGEQVVVEINSAPALEGASTLRAYTDMFVEKIRSLL